MKAETITGAMGTLEDAGFSEEQRMAIVKAIAEMQQPLFDAIEKLDSNVTDLRVEVVKRDVSLAKRETWLIFTGITLVLAILGGIVQLRAFMQPLMSAL